MKYTHPFWKGANSKPYSNFASGSNFSQYLPEISSLITHHPLQHYLIHNGRQENNSKHSFVKRGERKSYHGHWFKAHVLLCWAGACSMLWQPFQTLGLHYKKCPIVLCGTSETAIKRGMSLVGDANFLYIQIQTACDCFKGWTIKGCCWLESRHFW